MSFPELESSPGEQVSRIASDKKFQIDHLAVPGNETAIKHGSIRSVSYHFSFQKSVIPQMSLQSPIAPDTPNGFPSHNGFTPDHINENDVSMLLVSSNTYYIIITFITIITWQKIVYMKFSTEKPSGRFICLNVCFYTFSFLYVFVCI